MDVVALAAGLLIALAAFQLYREWGRIDGRQRLGNLLLMGGLAIAVVAPGIVIALGLDPWVGSVLRLGGFLFVLGAAYVIIG